MPGGRSRTAFRICWATVSASFCRGAWLISNDGNSSLIVASLAPSLPVTGRAPLDQFDLHPVGVEHVRTLAAGVRTSLHIHRFLRARDTGRLEVLHHDGEVIHEEREMRAARFVLLTLGTTGAPVGRW